MLRVLTSPYRLRPRRECQRDGWHPFIHKARDGNARLLDRPGDLIWAEGHIRDIIFWFLTTS